MDPRRVLTFRAVARHRSFSGAARALALSQPSVSNQVSALEREIGARLLEREPGGLRLTREGEILLEHAERAFAELEAGRQALHDLRGVVGGRVRVGTGATASIHLLPPVLGRLRARYPAIELWSSRATRGR